MDIPKHRKREAVYPEGIHGCIAGFLGKEEDLEVRYETNIMTFIRKIAKINKGSGIYMKSTAVNLYKVDQVKADLNMRLRLLMDNGEILILNRTYKKSFLEALHHIREVCYENH